jgi:hypothetical protein
MVNRSRHSTFRNISLLHTFQLVHLAGDPFDRLALLWERGVVFEVFRDELGLDAFASGDEFGCDLCAG